MPALIVSILPGLILTIIGLLFYKFRPKKINPWMGYRSRLSMSSQELWDEANRYSSIQMIRGGLLMLAFGFLFWLFGGAEFPIYGALVLAVVAFCMIFYTEKHLREFKKGR
jgi:uncharacterized membrane protein